MIDLPSLSEAGVWGSILSAIAASVALIFNANAITQQRRSNDATTLFTIAANIREAEARLTAQTQDPIAFKIELNNYLNLLEIFAVSVNHRLFGAKTRQLASDRLVTDLGMLLSNDLTRDHIEHAVTSEETFVELLAFYRRNRSKVDRAVSRLRFAPQSLTT